MKYFDYEKLTRSCIAYAKYLDAEAGYKKCSRYKITPQAERIKRKGLVVIQRIKDDVDFDNPYNATPVPDEIFELLAQVYNKISEIITQNRVVSRGGKRV